MSYVIFFTSFFVCFVFVYLFTSDALKAVERISNARVKPYEISLLPWSEVDTVVAKSPVPKEITQPVHLNNTPIYLERIPLKMKERSICNVLRDFGNVLCMQRLNDGTSGIALFERETYEA